MAQNNSTLYLLSYNNYYNRIVKREATLNDYLTYSAYTPLVCNFNPADGIDTEHIFNVPYVANTPAADYVVVVNEDNDITSRWFIVNATRTRGGQYRLSLHRDLLADYYDEVLTAPCYVERAMLQISSPFIFNSENMRFNQIKKKETLLKDRYDTPWIIGYLANNYYDRMPEGADYIQYTRNIQRSANISYSYSRLQELISKGGGTLFSNASTSNQDLRFVLQNDGIYYGWEMSQKRGLINQMAENNSYICNRNSAVQANELIRRMKEVRRKYYMSIATIPTYEPRYIQSAWISELTALHGQYIRNTDDEGPRYFSVKFYSTGSTTASIHPPVGSAGMNDIERYFNNNLLNDEDWPWPDSRINTNLADKIYFDIVKRNTVYVDIPVSTYQLSVVADSPQITARGYIGNASNKKAMLTDAPYTMFAMPYNNINVYRNDDNGPNILFTSEGNICSEMAAAIAHHFGSTTGFIYDLQLLPYSPIRGIPRISEEGGLDISGMKPNNYALIQYQDSKGEFSNQTNCGIIFFPEKSSFNLIIDLPEPISMPEDAIQAKIDIETKFCRLVSPNYSGAFEFSPLKNGGFSKVEVNATYKPYQPYIHLNPVFNSGYLYGGDFNDNRGLVCGGDFSLPQTTDAWQTFQIQNKSYEEAHAREVANMETNYDINRQQMKTAGIVNAVSAGLSAGSSAGMSAGLMGANPLAAAGIGAASGITSGILSGVGLSADLKAADALHKEALSFAGDMYNFNLQNIQAMPTTLSKTTAFDINSKYFPFVEFYEATPDEETALRNKITYNSMSVMAIGTIGQYKQTDRTFIQGQLIRIEGLGEDYHSAAAIAAEIQKGVFI